MTLLQYLTDHPEIDPDKEVARRVNQHHQGGVAVQTLRASLGLTTHQYEQWFTGKKTVAQLLEDYKLGLLINEKIDNLEREKLAKSVKVVPPVMWSSLVRPFRELAEKTEGFVSDIFTNPSHFYDFVTMPGFEIARPVGLVGGYLAGARIIVSSRIPKDKIFLQSENRYACLRIVQ